MAPAEIAFITVNYNTLDHVRRLADFFDTLDVPFTFSFTVADNHSQDGSQEFLQSHPKIRYLQTGGNIGYGRAINRGAAATASKYICVTNTDVLLNREALITLWSFMEEHPEAGVCAPRITYEDGRAQGMIFQPSLFAYFANWYAKLRANRAKMKLAKASAPLQVAGVMGAFFLIRRSVIPSPALFDEDFFFFYEDTALSHALKNRGVPCFILPNAAIIHIGGESRSEASIPLFYESRYLYLKKFYGPFQAKAIYCVDRARTLRKWAVYSLLSWISASERIRSKQRYYKIAWETARWK